MESKYAPSSASVSLETILVVLPVGFTRKKLNCSPLIFGLVKATVSVVLSYNHIGWCFPVEDVVYEASGRRNSDREKQETDTGVTTAVQDFKKTVLISI